MAVLSQDGFGVELYALDVQRPMAHAHDFFQLPVGGLRPGGDFQAIGQGRLGDGQRMVAGGGERII